MSEDDLLAGLRKKSDAAPEPDEDDSDDDAGASAGGKKAPKPLHHMDEGDTVPIQGDLPIFLPFSLNFREIWLELRDKIERRDILLHVYCVEDAKQWG